jgi:hypothetical protein
MAGHEVTEDAAGVPVTDRAQIHLALTAAPIREIGGPHGIGAAGGNDAQWSTTVVRTLNVRGLMPSIPISAMIFATVLALTLSPRSRSSSVIRGDP